MVKTSTALTAAAIGLAFVYFGGIGLTRRAATETKSAVEDLRGGLQDLAQATNKNNQSKGEMTAQNG